MTADRKVPIVSVVGKSGSGKTLFLEKLIPRLEEMGCRVGTIKHDVHGFDIDRPGKDTWRHKQAGAELVLISSPWKLALIKDVEEERELDELRDKYLEGIDIALTEGYKSGDKPKVEIYRPAEHDGPLCSEEDDDLLTTVINEECEDCDEDEIFSGEEVTRVAELLVKEFLPA